MSIIKYMTVFSFNAARNTTAQAARPL